MTDLATDQARIRAQRQRDAACIPSRDLREPPAAPRPLPKPKPRPPVPPTLPPAAGPKPMVSVYAKLATVPLDTMLWRGLWCVIWAMFLIGILGETTAGALMTPPRDYTPYIEQAKSGRCCLLDDEQLVREVLQAKRWRSRKRQPAGLKLLRATRYEVGLAECQRRGIGDLRGGWWTNGDGMFGLSAETAARVGELPQTLDPTERPRKQSKPLPPAPSEDGGELLRLLDASVAEAVQRNGSNGYHNRSNGKPN